MVKGLADAFSYIAIGLLVLPVIVLLVSLVYARIYTIWYMIAKLFDFKDQSKSVKNLRKVILIIIALRILLWIMRIMK